MTRRRIAIRLVYASVMVITLATVGACSRGEDPPPSTADHTATAHNDHTPKFGGLVLMDRDLHFEVLAESSGDFRVYFSDDRRNPLPASSVANPVVTVMRPNADAEVVELQKDASDASWIGKSRPVELAESSDTMVRVSYLYRDQSYWIDLPFSGFPSQRQGSR